MIYSKQISSSSPHRGIDPISKSSYLEKYETGDIFLGEKSRGVKCGIGLLVQPTGMVYEGDW